MTQTKLRSVTTARPCLVCEGDHKCSHGADGVILCGRRQGPQSGFICLGPAKGDPQFTLYRQVGDPQLDQLQQYHCTANGATPRDKPAEMNVGDSSVLGANSQSEHHQDAGPKVNWTAKAAECANALTPARMAELAKTLGLPAHALHGLGLGYCQVGPHRDEHAAPLGDCWTFPMFDASGTIVGLSCRYRNGTKKNWPRCKQGLFLPEGWKDREGPLLLPEGASGTAALTAMNLSAVGRPSNVGGIGHLAQLLRDTPVDRQIVVLADFDPRLNGQWPGKEGAIKTAAELAKQLGRSVGYAFPPGRKKDSRDWTAAQDLDASIVDAWHDAGGKFVAELQLIEIKPLDDASVSRIVTCDELLQRHPERRPAVIEGLLREGETMNVIAAPKIGKSWLTLGLAFSVAAGQPWLSTFDTRQGNVLLIDNELHAETLAHRLRTLARYASESFDEVRSRISIATLRGRLQNLDDLGKWLMQIERGRFCLVIIDAWYRTLPLGTDENDNAAVAGLYNRLDQIADAMGSAFAIVHHSSKGNQSNKSVTDVGAGAGAQSRAADTHVVLRAHEEADAVVLEAAVRSWAPLEPRPLRWAFPLWTPAPDLDPAALRADKPRRRKADEKEPEEPAEPPWDAKRFAQAFGTPEPKPRSVILDSARQLGLSDRKAEQLLKAAIDREYLHSWKEGGANTRTLVATARPPEPSSATKEELEEAAKKKTPRARRKPRPK